MNYRTLPAVRGVWVAHACGMLLCAATAVPALAADSSAAGAAALKVLLDSEDRARHSSASDADRPPAAPAAAPQAARPATARPAPARSNSNLLSTGARSTVQVPKTETLESVIQRTLPDLPLKETVIRSAFMQLNPHAFPVRSVTVIRAGSVLQVPNADDLRAAAMRDSPSAQALFLGGGGMADAPREVTAEDKRQWVRFP